MQSEGGKNMRDAVSHAQALAPGLAQAHQLARLCGCQAGESFSVHSYWSAKTGCHSAAVETTQAQQQCWTQKVQGQTYSDSSKLGAVKTACGSAMHEQLAHWQTWPS